MGVLGITVLLAALGTVALAQASVQPGQASVTPKYPGGYLKFTYEGTTGGAATVRTTVEIVPLPDGRYEVRTASTQTTDADRVRISFFGLGWVGFGFRLRDPEQGGLDLSGLSSLEQLTLVPGKTYLLPDGAMFQAGERDNIAGIEVIRGVYTHANTPDLKLELAWALNPEVRALLPFPPYTRLLQRRVAGGPFDLVVTEIRLTEFVRR